MVQTDLERLGTFNCSDGRLNRLHDIVEWSFRGNACEVPTDCPQREKAGWTGDWQLFVPTAAYLFDVAGFSAKWLRDVRTDQWDNGVVANISPVAGPAATGAEFMAFTNGSSGWGDAVVMVPWEIYLATGDTGILEENWEAINRWLGFIRSAAEGNRHPAGIGAATPAPHEQYLWDTGFHFGEWMEPGGPAPDLLPPGPSTTASWPPPTTGTPPPSWPGLPPSWAGRMKPGNSGAVRKRPPGLAAGIPAAADGQWTVARRPTACARWPLTWCPHDGRPAVVKQLAALVRDAGTHLGTGFLATPYLLPVLADNGQLDLAYELLMQDSAPSWLVMVDRGATTIWEAWNGIGPDGTTARLAEPLQQGCRGLVPAPLHRRPAPGARECGLERIIIEPRPGAGMTSASHVAPGPAGPHRGDWTIDDGVLHAHRDRPVRHHGGNPPARPADRRRRTRNPYLYRRRRRRRQQPHLRGAHHDPGNRYHHC